MSDTRHLEVFLAVWDEASFSGAARKMRCTQPTVSRGISDLEAELGSPLFDRTTRRVTPTEAARALEPFARRTLASLSHGLAIARQAGAGEVGTLRIGHTSTVPFHPAFVRVLSLLRTELPELRLEVVEHSSGDQLRALTDGELDLGWVRPDRLPKRGGLVARRIDLEKVHVAVPHGHELAGRRRVSLPELAQQTFVMPDPALGSSLGRLYAAVLGASAEPPKTSLFVRHVTTVLPLVAAGLGIALVPASLARSPLLPRAGLRSVPLRESSARLPLFLVRRSNDRRPAVSRVLAVALEREHTGSTTRVANPRKRVTSSPER